ncbi:tyrosine-type recombinase/integrase [bacterium]|nr:tyrosine-type recombinase/integrase [bacterium]
MASITSQKNGCRILQYIAQDRKRRTIRLGKMPAKQADQIRRMVEALVASQITGFAPDDEVSRWVARLDDYLAGKLSEVGLIPRRESLRLGPYLDSYITSRSDVKPGTRSMYLQTRNALVTFFTTDKPLREITPGDADEWVLWMMRQEWAPNTCRKRSAIAKLFFNAALRKKLISESPFRDLKGTVRPNSDRLKFISVADIRRVIDQSPDPEWQLIIALARFGGLRTPSETLTLRWEDVNWAENRLTIWSPKTAHHAGKECRVIPLFPELRPFLEAAFHAAPDGAVYVVERVRSRSANLRTQMLRMIRRAGLEPWTRPFHNLRASCETDLANRFPAHVVAKWLGNSVQVAAAHYLQVTDEHFRAASTDGGALQNALQQVAVRSDTKPQADRRNALFPACFSEVRKSDGDLKQGKYSREDSNL